MPVTIVGNNTPTAGGVVYGDGTNYVSTAAGTAGQFLQSNGASAPVWAAISSSPNLVRSARTSNTILGAADKGTLIAITSGTFTQTFTAAATLGSGWWCYIQNAGTGEITLDPNASETIDGLTSYIMYPNEVRLVQCDGTGFNTVVVDPFYAVFTASGTFTKPPGYALFGGYLWGAGGGGSKQTDGATSAGGGGGGACFAFTLPQSLFGATETITIGLGGTGPTADATNGGAGGNSSIGSVVTGYGGGGGNSGSSGVSAGNGGGGGGWTSAGATGGTTSTSGQGGNPVVETRNPTDVLVGGVGFGGGHGGPFNSFIKSAAYGGGGGGTASAGGGNSVYGGGGGGGQATTLTAGTSIYGGSGGTGTTTTTGNNGTAPGGGGGATRTGTKAGDGARGELRIWGVM